MKIVHGFGSYSTNDIKKAQEFYTKTLGLKAEIEEEMGIMRVKMPGSEAMIYPKDEHKAADFTVLNLVVDDIEAAVAELKDGGVEFEQYDNDWIKTDKNGLTDPKNGPRMAWFKDPAGNILSLIENK